MAHTVPPIRHLIGASWREGCGETLPVTNPSTGETVATYRAASARDVDDAVGAAHEALATWSTTSPARRQELLWKLADAIEARSEEFALLESLNTGKPLSLTTRGEVPAAIAMIRYNAGWATKLHGETREVSLPGTWHAYTERRPIGVVGLIAPWNNPLMMAAAKIAPALAAGCTVVLKPAELTPVTAILLGEVALEVGIPAGVINIVTGLGPVVGEAIATHPLVRKVSFTGSTAVGKHLQRLTADSLKPLSLELGGKSPVIVWGDADLDEAARAVAQSIFTNSGQVCAAGSRLYVEESVAEEFLAKVAAVASELRLGDALVDGTTTGPLISAAQQERVLGYIEQGIADGARVVAGGAALDRPGFFIEPTILADVTEDMSVVREEIFGPVLVCQTFRADDDLLRRVNDSEYGLSSYVWTRDLSRAHRLARGIEAGNVRVNAYSGMDPNMPFGGVKNSGYGKENGREGVEAYTQLTTVTMKLG